MPNLNAFYRWSMALICSSLLACETPLLDLSSSANQPPPSTAPVAAASSQITDLSGCWTLNMIIRGEPVNQEAVRFTQLNPNEYQTETGEKVTFTAGKVIYPIRIPNSPIQGDLQMDVQIESDTQMRWLNPIDASTGESAGDLSFLVTRCDIQSRDISGCWVGRAVLNGQAGELFPVQFEKRDEKTYFDEVLLELKFLEDGVASLPLDPTQDPPELGRFEFMFVNETHFVLSNPKRVNPETNQQETLPMLLQFERCPEGFDPDVLTPAPEPEPTPEQTEPPAQAQEEAEETPIAETSDTESSDSEQPMPESSPSPAGTQPIQL